MEFAELKKKYEELEKKFKLPSFKEMNEDFEIGKIEQDTGMLLRAIRKTAMDKIISSLNFVEMLLHPMSSPNIYLPFLKSMREEDKKIIDKIYISLGELTLKSAEREINYDEKSEAELIREIFKIWNELKEDFSKLIEKIRKPNSIEKKERSYFG